MAITKIGIKIKPVKRKIITLSGLVYVEGSPASRRVLVYKESTGLLAAKTISDSATGAWSISLCDNANDKYFAVCVADSDSRNSEVFGHLSGV